jgi:hypothetical protein
MSFLQGLLTDLRQRRLWPVPLALIAAIVAVPVVLSKQAQAPAPLPVVHGPVSGTPVAAVNVNNSPSDTHPSGHARDPFAQPKLGKASTTAASTSSSSSSSSTSSSASVSGGSPASTGSSGSTASNGGSAGTGGSSPSTSSGSSPAGSPPASPVAPGAKPTPAPSGLTAKQSYDVALSITNASGGLNQTDPLERLSVLPSNQQPLLVELGVLKGGKRVVFAVQPGTVVTGGAACTPGPIDCEILTVAQDQTVTLSTQSKAGPVYVAKFAIIGITAQDNGSAAAANRARRKESAAGRKLLDSSNSSSLSLFQYDPTVGAVVDLRNLTVGGN